MNLFNITKFDDQIPTLQVEFESSSSQLLRTLVELVGNSLKLKELSDKVDRATEIDDDSHNVLEKALGDFEGELDYFKDEIRQTISNIDDHICNCTNLRHVLEQLLDV
jgi:hypothetical protein